VSDGVRRAAIALAVLLLAGLAAGFLYAVERRHDEAEKRRRTLETLRALVQLVQDHDLGATTTDIPPPRALGGRDDPTGMLALHEYLMGGHYLLNSDPETAGGAFLRGELANDAWGRPIRYRCPGVRDRWDFSSLGADGVDEHGEGDDLVLGPGSSSIRGTRR
jgi:hypothetical protein